MTGHENSWAPQTSSEYKRSRPASLIWWSASSAFAAVGEVIKADQDDREGVATLKSDPD